MKYEVVAVLDGEYSKDIIYVLHGSPELPRRSYNKVHLQRARSVARRQFLPRKKKKLDQQHNKQFSGTLSRFDIGARHLLQLKEKLPYNNSPFTIVVDPYESLENESSKVFTRFLALKADLDGN